VGGTAPGAHVGIVEDSPLVYDAMRILFTERGYRVSVCATVRDAVTLCSTDTLDVLLLDLTLPDGDGLSVLETLDAGHVRRPPRVLALTGHGDPETMSRCLQAGCERVLVKPVSIRELLRIVQDG
jgi:DNA-binding response OmpR family regulator